MGRHRSKFKPTWLPGPVLLLITSGALDKCLNSSELPLNIFNKDGTIYLLAVLHGLMSDGPLALSYWLLLLLLTCFNSIALWIWDWGVGWATDENGYLISDAQGKDSELLI